MQRSLDRDTALQILNEAFGEALAECDYYLKQHDFETAAEVFIKEIAIVFGEHGHVDFKKKIEDVSETLSYQTQLALETVEYIEELRKIVEKIFVSEFFDNPDNESQ